MELAVPASAHAWRVVAASVTGRQHRLRDRGNEDAIASGAGPSDALVLVVADGAGSAKLAAEGSRIASQNALQWLLETDCSTWEERFPTTLRTVRSALGRRARELRKRPGQLASTLLVAALAPGESWFLQLGDGAIVLRRDGKWTRALEPHSGEYAGETVFTTSRNAAKLVRIERTDTEGVEAVALLSDGLEPVATNVASGEPHSPFFDPLLDFAKRDLPTADLSAQLQEFLEGERIQERTGDDLSLILACRT